MPSTQVVGLDRRFDPIVDRAMQTDRDQRYSSAVELRADLDPILRGPAPAAPSRRRPLLIAATLVVLERSCRAWQTRSSATAERVQAWRCLSPRQPLDAPPQQAGG